MALQEYIDGIKGLDEEAMDRAKERVDSLIKPLGSLGKLEDMAIRIAGISGRLDYIIDKKCTVIMAADNGVVEEGVCSSPQEITAMQTINMLKGLTGICALSKQAGADMQVVDIGVNADISHPQLLSRKLMYGTNNLLREKAMSRETAEEAIGIGIQVVQELVEKGYTLLGTGEMGIGNTSTSSAVLMALTGCHEDVAVGKGGGLTDEGLLRKKQVIRQAIDYHQPQPEDPIDILSKVGGLDIAGLVGCYIGAAYYRIPIVIDGFISSAAALLAYHMNPLTRDYMMPSHYSLEPGYALMMAELGLEPILHMDMRLGEGSGCPLAYHLIESSLAMMQNMATFQEVTMATDFLVDIREEEELA